MKNETLEFYNRNAESYVKSTINLNMKENCDIFLSYLKKNALICDLGCGSCRDTIYFRNKGFSVIPIDGSKQIALEAEKLTGQKVICQNFLDFNYENKFDGIWACASIHHLQKPDFTKVMEKIENSLKENGILYFCAKFGTTERVDDKGRVFLDFNENNFSEFLEASSLSKKLKIAKVYISGDTMNRPDTCWANFIITKNRVQEFIK